MFTIVISEKGGAERRETFDRSEISVGRVQGNDLMLPKGNVSKHHARLLLRDARFIVTDLKSTNGTYVNGRKISQATVVRQGDKIYVGDFVLRVETAQGATASPTPPAEPVPPPRSPLPTSQEMAPPGGQPTPSSPSLPPPGSAGTPSPMATPVASVSAPPPHRARAPSAVSHYPLERDPDSEGPPALRGAHNPQLPGPPRLPQTVESRARSMAALRPERLPPPPRAAEQSLPLPPAPRPASLLPPETAEQASRRLALTALVGRIAGEVDAATLDRPPGGADLQSQVERVARAQLTSLREAGNIPESIETEDLVGDAVREFSALGPIGPLLEDPEVDEIHVAAGGRAVFCRAGIPRRAETSFTSDHAVGRVVARLASQTGAPLRPDEWLVERSLDANTSLVAVGPPVSRVWSLTVRRRRRIQPFSLDELVAAGAMSQPMATFLETCVGARINTLVVGRSRTVVGGMLGALAASAPAGERTITLQSDDAIFVADADGIVLAGPNRAAPEPSLVRAAVGLGADRLVIASLGSGVTPSLIEAIGSQDSGVLAGLEARSLRHGLARVAVQVTLGRPGVTIEASREAVSELFGVAVELGHTPDGKLRVMRIAELTGADGEGVTTSDLFVANFDATGKANFVSLGTIPRFAFDLAADGRPLDVAMFGRPR